MKSVPDCWPDTDEVRRDFAEFFGAIASADAAVGQLLDVLAATGLDANTWVVFVDRSRAGVSPGHVHPL